MANCPECNTPDAYIGFMVVECLNPQCRHYVAPRGKIGQAFLGSAPLSGELQTAVDAFMTEEFPGEVDSIHQAVGGEIPITMDFRNVGSDVRAFRLLVRVLRRVRAALCLRSSQHQAALKEGIKRVAIRLTGSGERRACTLTHGVLDMRVSTERPAPTGTGTIEYDENDVDRLLADALDLELGPKLRELQEWLLGAIAELNEAERLHVKLDVDWRSFTASPDNRVNLRRLDQLQDELSRHILYWLRSHAANDKPFRKQLKQTVHTLRVEHVSNASEREVGVIGPSVFYKLCLSEDGGAYGYKLGDVLLSAVMSVQPPPAPEALKTWLANEGQAQLAEIAKLGDSVKRRDLESYLPRELAAAALGLQQAVRGPLIVDLNWESIAHDMNVVPHLVPRVLTKLAGALRLVAKNEEHAKLLKAGAIKLVSIRCVADANEKSCALAPERLNLAVAPLQPGTGCFDEGELASKLNDHLATAARLNNLQQKETPETVVRLCEAVNSWIDFEVDWAGFTSHSEPGKNQFALIQLSEVGLGWVFYALSGQCEEDAEFKARLADRVRKLRLAHVPSAKEKDISFEGSTLVYKMFLHTDYNGRFVIDHLKEIFAEVVERMAPGAPPSPKVIAEIEACERDALPLAAAKLAKMLGHDVTITIDRASIGNNLIAAHHLADDAVKILVAALNDFAGRKPQLKQLSKLLGSVTIRHAASRDENTCTLADGLLTVNTWLGTAKGHDGLSEHDIRSAVHDVLDAEFESSKNSAPAEEEEEDEDSEDSSPRNEGEDLEQWLETFRTQVLPQYLVMLNHVNASNITLEGEWESFEEHLTSDSGDEVRACLETAVPLMLTALVQMQMTVPGFGPNLKAKVTTLSFECADPGEEKDLRREGDILVYRLQPADGFAGGYELQDVISKLQRLIGP